MLPAKFHESNAMFNNVGVAVGAINLLENGIYIALDGQAVSCQKYQGDRNNTKDVE